MFSRSMGFLIYQHPTALAHILESRIIWRKDLWNYVYIDYDYLLHWLLQLDKKQKILNFNPQFPSQFIDLINMKEIL